MSVLTRLLDFLPTYFNVDPRQQVAFNLLHQTPGASMVWSVADDKISAQVFGSVAKDFEISLLGKTIQQVVDEINAVPNYLAVMSSDTGARAAICLADVEKESDSKVHIFTSPTWALFKSISLELKEARLAGDEILRQLSIPGATGALSDHWGGYFSQGSRRPGEDDASFNQRIVDSIKAPKSNNVAMEIILENNYGYYIRVFDLDFIQESTFLMNNLNTPFHDVRFPLFDVTAIGKEACVFGLMFPEGTISQWNQSQFDELRALIDSMRAAGTRAKAFWVDEPVFTPDEIPYIADYTFNMKYI